MKKKRKTNNSNYEAIKKIDREIENLLDYLSNYDPGVKDDYIVYGQYTRRLTELTDIRNKLIGASQSYHKDTKWLEIAKLGISAAAVIAPFAEVVLLRNSEINNERIFGRSIGWKHLSKTPNYM